MPNRIIRDGWIDSPKIDALSADAERFFLRLMLRADDFGRYAAHSVILKNTLFPIREDISSLQCRQWLTECRDAKLVRVYQVEGSDYVEIINFQQRTRAMKSKFPPPSDSKKQPPAKNPPSNDGQVTVICQTDGSQPRTETETETEANSESGGAFAPTLATAIAFGQNIGIPKTVCEKWWLETDGRGWKDGRGQPVIKWQSAIQAFWVSWQGVNNQQKAKQDEGLAPKSQKNWSRTMGVGTGSR